MNGAQMQIKRSSYVTSKGFFRYSEFYRSAKYPRLAAGALFDQATIESIFFWVECCGDPFRQLHPKIRLCTLSGVRGTVLNKKVHGSTDSDHLADATHYYSAVDLYSPDVSPASLLCLIIDQHLPYRQLIYYPRKKFIHWSWNVPGKPFKQEVKIK
jgi:hypothetical protein